MLGARRTNSCNDKSERGSCAGCSITAGALFSAGLDTTSVLWRLFQEKYAWIPEQSNAPNERMQATRTNRNDRRTSRSVSSIRPLLDKTSARFKYAQQMRIDILTLFPEICRAPLDESMMKRAQSSGALDLRIHNLRDWTTDKHRIVDDAPFGGGPGMVMKPEPIFAAVESLRSNESFVLLMTPQGKTFTQKIARDFSTKSHLIIVCGHYEGIDHRVAEHLADAEISIGDYVLTNGAIAAVVVVDAVVRLLPGVLGHEHSAADDSFSSSLLEGPQYTRPADFRGWKIPDVLLSGNHAEIAAWRKAQALKETSENRPDLLK